MNEALRGIGCWWRPPGSLLTWFLRVGAIGRPRPLLWPPRGGCPPWRLGRCWCLFWALLIWRECPWSRTVCKGKFPRLVSWRSWCLLGLGLDWALFGQLQKFWRDKLARSNSIVSATSISSMADSNLSNRGESLMIRLVILLRVVFLILDVDFQIVDGSSWNLSFEKGMRKVEVFSSVFLLKFWVSFCEMFLFEGVESIDFVWLTQ